jgi:hypothetical protein
MAARVASIAVEAGGEDCFGDLLCLPISCCICKYSQLLAVGWAVARLDSWQEGGGEGQGGGGRAQMLGKNVYNPVC